MNVFLSCVLFKNILNHVQSNFHQSAPLCNGHGFHKSNLVLNSLQRSPLHLYSPLFSTAQITSLQPQVNQGLTNRALYCKRSQKLSLPRHVGLRFDSGWILLMYFDCIKKIKDIKEEEWQYMCLEQNKKLNAELVRNQKPNTWQKGWTS